VKKRNEEIAGKENNFRTKERERERERGRVR
jgi:hypothetical protein